jgi:hypothetical protein
MFKSIKNFSFSLCVNIRVNELYTIYSETVEVLSFVNINISRYILVLDTSVFAKNNMGQREYLFNVDGASL